MGERAFEAPLRDEVELWQHRLDVAAATDVPAIAEVAVERLDSQLGLKGSSVLFMGVGYIPFFDEDKTLVGIGGPVETTEALEGVSQGVDVMMAGPESESGADRPLILHKVTFLKEVLYPDEVEGSSEPRELLCYLDLTASESVAIDRVEAAIVTRIHVAPDGEVINNFAAVVELAERYRQGLQSGQFRDVSEAACDEVIRRLTSFSEQQLNLTDQRLLVLSDDAYVLQNAPGERVRLKRTQALRHEERLVTFLGVTLFEGLGGQEQVIPGLRHQGLCMVVDSVLSLADAGVPDDNLLYIPLADNNFDCEIVSSTL